MSRWIRAGQQRDEWAALFTGFQQSAYRQECQQIYRSSAREAEAVERFVAGLPRTIQFDWAIPKLQAQVAAGRTQTNVRVVVEPPTDYTRWQLSTYPDFVEAGGDYRVIAVPAGDWPAGLPDYDFWMFDDRDVWRMHYHADHTYIGAELLDGADVVRQHLRYRDLALAQARSVAEYTASHPDLDWRLRTS